MPDTTLDQLRIEALKLSDRDRAELARDLVASLDAPFDADAAEAWDVELRRRLAQIDDGTARLVDRDEFRRRLSERLAAR